MNLSQISLAITRPRGGGGGVFNPAVLWPLGASSPGMWIDPPYVASLFSTSAGTTAISAIGTVLDSNNPVGLALDRKGGLELGPELMIGDNSTFTSGVGDWTFQANVTPAIVGGRLQCVFSGGGDSASISPEVMTAGKNYIVTVSLESSLMPIASYCYGASGDAVFPAQPLVRTVQFVILNAATRFSLYVSGSVATTYYLDSVSVKEIPGIHLSQATATSRPVASARVNLFTYSQSFSNAVWLKENANVTISATGVTDPDGGTTAVTLTWTGESSFYQNTTSVPLIPYSAKIWMKGVAGETIGFWADWGSADAASRITVTLTGTWQLVTAGRTAGVGTICNIGPRKVAAEHTASSVSIAFAHYNIGSTALPYQRVAAASDYDASAGPTYTKLDGTDDSLASATFAAGTLTSSMDCLIAVRLDATTNAIVGLYGTAGNMYFGAVSSGSTGTTIGAGAGASGTVWLDGVELAGGASVTQGTLFTALTKGVWHILEFRGLDLSTWTQVLFGAYSSFWFTGGLGEIQLFASGQDANRDLARAAMANYFGVTLP